MSLISVSHLTKSFNGNAVLKDVNAETGKMEIELTQGSLLTLSDERDLRALHRAFNDFK